MRKNVIFSLLLTVCVIVLSFACVKTDISYDAAAENKNTQVLTVSKNDNQANPVLEARFLNMLNHNFVYNEDFYEDSVLVNNSLVALLNVAEDSFVKQTYVEDYIFNMYGKIYDGFDFLGENLPEKSGYVYIIPRGYSEYTHKIVSLTDNKDGSYTVISEVEISNADGSVENLKAETVFLENTESDFGYNIMYSEIIENVLDVIDC